MAFADAIKYNRVRSMKGLPIGAIIPWASDQSTIPPGWIVCNGATISNTRYPLLFKIIGNVYGGTAGSTYRLPPLTNGSPGIVDIFRGHYVYFKGAEINALPGNEVNRPTSNSDTFDSDRFWSIVGRGNNGDTGNTPLADWQSDIDLVGEEISTTVQFQGIYDDITVEDGSYSFTATLAGESLGVEHLPEHSHADPSTDATSYNRRGNRASWCWGQSQQADCRVNCTTTPAFRVSANPAVHVRESFGDRPGPGGNRTDLNDNFLDTNNNFVGEGGGGRVQTTNQFGETNATVYSGGDGRCRNNMRCGNQVLFTSLSHAETVAGAEHFHGSNTYNLQGRFRVTSPGLRRNIALNTVRINNVPGQNFGVIRAQTATPSLEMLFIIRAY